MKHVWILNHYANGPADASGPTRHYSLARHLLSRGWKTTIVAASTTHPAGRQRTVEDEASDRSHDVRFLRLAAPEYDGNGADRVRNMLAYAWRAATSREVRALDRPDAIIGSSPHPAAALAAAWLARRYRVPFLYEVRDPWPQALIEMGRIGESGATARAMRAIERHLFRAATRSIVLWPNMAAYLRERGIDAPDPVWISNGVDLAALPRPAPPPERAGLRLMYLGAHGGANGLDNLIRAMRIVQDRAPASGIALRLIGDGPQKPALRDLAREIGATRVQFEDPVAKQRVPEVAAEADAFAFNLIGAPMFRFGISPNKLFEYMAAQRPVIFCCEAFNNPVAECGGGITAPPNDPERLAGAILELADMSRDARAEMGLAARRHVEAHFSAEALAERLADVLDECVAAG